MAQELRRTRWLTLLAAAALASLVWAVFFPILGFEFIEYDVPEQVLRNPHVQGLTGENLKQILTTKCVTSYYPVRTLTFALDYQIWGMNPRGFKLTNGLIHLANVLLVFWLVLRLFPRSVDASPPAWWDVLVAGFSAGIFAVHPLVVEPVTWVAGREELLMTLGALGCIHFHVSARCCGQDAANTRRALGYHAGAAFCCAVACLSNAMAAAIPLLITAWDIVALTGPKLRKIVAGTACLWLVAAMTIFLKTEAKDLAGQTGVFSTERLMLVLNVYWLNLMTFIRPTHLVLEYPCAVPKSFLDAQVILGGLALILTCVLLWTLRRQKPLLFALAWFCLALTPSSQIMNHEIHRADRFLYLPLVGLALAVAMGLRLLRSLLKGRGTAPLIAVAGVCGLLAILSAGQVQRWRNTLSVWTNCLAVYPDHPMAYACVAHQMAKGGRMREAIEYYEISILFQPDNKFFLQEFALDLATCPEKNMRDYDRAIELAERACQLTKKKDGESLLALAVVYAEARRFEEAKAAINAAIELARADGRSELIKGLRRRLENYQRGIPNRDPL